MILFGASSCCNVRIGALSWCFLKYIILYARWYLVFNVMKYKGNLKLACNLQSYWHVVLTGSAASKTNVETY